MLKIFPRTFVTPLFLGALFIGFLASLSYLGDMAGMSFIQRLPEEVLSGVQLFVTVGWTLLYLSAVSSLVALYIGIREFFFPKGSKEFFRWGGVASFFIGALLVYSVMTLVGLIFLVGLYLVMGTPAAPLFIGDFSARVIYSELYVLSVASLLLISIKGGMIPLFGTAFWGIISWVVSLGCFLICNKD